MRTLFISLMLAGFLLAGEYQVDSNKQNKVKFISDAPIEDFEGVTDAIDGYLYYEGEDILNKSELYFEVELNTLDTGIGLRNRHMRENYLETDNYPKAYFKGKIINASVAATDSFMVEASGTFHVHGADRPLNVTGTLIRSGNLLEIKTAFVVKLSDYNIEIPSIMFYKIDENMRVEADFFVKEITE